MDEEETTQPTVITLAPKFSMWSLVQQADNGTTDPIELEVIGMQWSNEASGTKLIVELPVDFYLLEEVPEFILHCGFRIHEESKRYEEEKAKEQPLPSLSTDESLELARRIRKEMDRTTGRQPIGRIDFSKVDLSPLIDSIARMNTGRKKQDGAN
jgi:hypothetical protein